MSQTTTPSGADVDLMAVFADCISKLEYHYRDTRAGAEMTQARTAVAALIAERDSQKDRIRSVCQMIVAEIGAGCPCNLEDAAAKLIARNAELEAERDALRKMWQQAEDDINIRDAKNKALRRAFPKPRNRCCMNCAEHGSCNPDGLNGCAYDDSGEDYDRGWNDCLDAALARTLAPKENDDASD